MNIKNTMEKFIKKLNKKSVKTGGIALIISFLAVAFWWGNTLKYTTLVKNQYNQFKTNHPNEKGFSKDSLDRTIASDDFIVDHLQGRVLSGNILGPRGFGKFIVKFNTSLETTKKSRFPNRYYPVYFKNSRCVIYGTIEANYGIKVNVKKIKQRRYGIHGIDKPYGDNNFLGLSISNYYASPEIIYIDVYGIERTTPLSEIEELCENVFSFKTLF